MIIRIEIENFRGLASRKVIECVNLHGEARQAVCINGAPSVGKTTIVESLLFLQYLARGMTRVEQYCSGDGFAISANPQHPVDIVILFAADGLQYTYGIRLEYEGIRKWQVENEWINVNGGVVLARIGNHVETGVGRTSYELDRAVFALPTFVTQDANHPVARVRGYLAGLFILVPTPLLFSDVVVAHSKQVFLDAYGRNIGSWMAAFFGVNMSAYPRFTGLLARYIIGFQGVKVLPGANESSRMCLVIRLADGGLREVPLSMLSYRQKLIVLGCLILTVGQTLPNMFCVWDDFDMMVDASLGVATSLCDAFAGKGQLVFTSLRNFAFQGAMILQLQ